jgi:putative intracellular protease/amidase
MQDRYTVSGMNRDVLMPLPDRDFDVTEVAVPWKLLTQAGYRVIFATEHGATPAADPLLLEGVIFGKLGASAEAIACYRELETSPAFIAPRRWQDLEPADFAGLFLPGGHAPGMKQYLGSSELHAWIARFWRTGRPVAAICHGVLALARATDESGRSVLHDRRTTCLPKYMERTAYLLTFWKLGRYYRTYAAYVEDEVRAALADPSRFVRGPRTLVARGTLEDDAPAFVVEDGAYVSARWPGDSYLVTKRFVAHLEEAGAAARGAGAESGR